MKARELKVEHRISVGGETLKVVALPDRVLPHVKAVDGVERSMHVDCEDASGEVHGLSFRPSEDVLMVRG